MSNYEDPKWYERQAPHPPSQPPSNNNFGQYPSFFMPEDDAQEEAASLRSRRTTGGGHILRQVLVLTALVAIAFVAGWFSHQFFGDMFFPSNDKSEAYLQLFQQAWHTVDQNYVDRKAVDYKKMSYAAIDAMIQSLNDKGHTRFLKPEEVQAENQQLSGKFTGIGIYLHQDKVTKQLIVTSPIPGSPAEKAGLKHGDVIVAVNGVSTVGKDVTGVSGMIQGHAGSSVDITVQRPGAPKPIDFKVMRAEIQVPNVFMHYIPESHIAHIQVVQFADGVSDEVKDAVTKAKKMGATKIILDLRDNPGGYLQEAINTTSLFVNNGNVLLEQDSTGQRKPEPVKGDAIDTSSQMVVLVNENSASAAEIVAGALHDNHRATVVGKRTFGTGTVLLQYTLSDGSAILLGTQEWLTPDGHFIRSTGPNNGGIVPDIPVDMTGPNATILSPNDENTQNLGQQQILNSGDAQLNAAIKYLQEH